MATETSARRAPARAEERAFHETEPTGDRRASRRARSSGVGLVLASGLLCAAFARAESDLIFPTPEDMSRIAATTFDLDGTAVGQSSFWIEKEAPDRLTMKIELAIEGGGVNRSQATFIRDGGIQEGGNENGEAWEAGRESSQGDTTAVQGLRLIEQRSEARRADGFALPLLVIDHQQKRATCRDAAGAGGSERSIELPDQDRVVNVPLQLLFEPLVAGERESIDFQLVLCRKGPVVYDMVARRGLRSALHPHEILEIEYGPDLGRSMGWLARKVLPRFAFWFDAKRGDYLAHQMPLHTKGPEILLVRKGLRPKDLGLSDD